MADIDAGMDEQRPTTTELANAARISRARFIGNMVGALLLLAIVAGIYLALSAVIGMNPFLYSAISPKPGTTFLLPSHGATFIFALLALIIFTDLAMRRRHDRNRSGVDVIVFGEIAVGGLVAALFAPPSPASLGFAAILAVLGLWLLVALVLLPGTKGPNRYGEDPRDMLRRAGH